MPEHSRIRVADRSEQPQQVLTRAIAIVARSAAYGVDEPRESIVNMPAEQIQIGDQGLRINVIRIRGRGRPSNGEIHTKRALQHLRHGQSGRGFDIGRVRIHQLLVLRDRAVDVTFAQGPPGRRRTEDRRTLRPLPRPAQLPRG